jgi:hypothetical protein
MATLRADGSPRVSGIECEFTDGDLRFGSMTGARKGADLKRDPRFALHGPTFHPEEGKEGDWPGEAKIAGRAVPAGPVATDGANEQPDGEMFVADITEVVITGLNATAIRLVAELLAAGSAAQVGRSVRGRGSAGDDVADRVDGRWVKFDAQVEENRNESLGAPFVEGFLRFPEVEHLDLAVRVESGVMKPAGRVAFAGRGEPSDRLVVLFGRESLVPEVSADCHVHLSFHPCCLWNCAIVKRREPETFAPPTRGRNRRSRSA